jgi:hypothetical protein
MCKRLEIYIKMPRRIKVGLLKVHIYQNCRNVGKFLKLNPRNNQNTPKRNVKKQTPEQYKPNLCD